MEIKKAPYKEDLSGMIYSLGMPVPTDKILLSPPCGWDTRYLIFDHRVPSIWNICRCKWVDIPNMRIHDWIIFYSYLFDGVYFQTYLNYMYFINNQGEVRIERDYLPISKIVGYVNKYYINNYNILTCSDNIFLYRTGEIMGNNSINKIYRIKLNPFLDIFPLHRGFMHKGHVYDIWGEYLGKVDIQKGDYIEI